MSEPDAVAGPRNRNQLRRDKFRPDNRSPQPEVISDSDEHDQRQAKKPRLSETARNHGLNPISDRRSKQPTEDDLREARLLGNPSEREPGETTINDPVSREDRERMRKKPNISKGPVPSNTLDSAKRAASTSKAAYMRQHLGQRGRVSQAGMAQVSAEQTGYPNKRQKLDGSSPGNSTRRPLNPAKRHRQPSVVIPSRTAGQTQADAISLEDSQEGDGLTPVPAQDTIRQSTNNGSEKLPAVGSATVEVTVQGPELQHVAATPKSASHRRPSSTQRSVPALSRMQNGANSPPDATSSDGELFMHGAKRQRKESQHQQDDDDVQELHAQPVKRSTRLRAPAQRLAQSTPQRAARTVAVPPDSPDELQADSKTRNAHTASQLGAIDQLTPNLNAQRYIKGDPNRGKLSRPRSAVKEAAPTKATQYKLKEIATPMLPRTEENFYQIDIHSDGAFCIVPQDSQLMADPILSKNVAEIYMINYGEDSCLCHLKFRPSNNEQCSLRFGSHKTLIDFVKHLQEFNAAVNVVSKPDQWMSKRFKQTKDMEYREPVERADIFQTAAALELEVAEMSKPSVDPPRRSRTTDKLDAPAKDTRPSDPSVITGRDRRGGESLSPVGQVSNVELAEPKNGAEVTKKTKHVSEFFNIRYTRSQPTRTSRATAKAKEPTPQRERINRLDGIEPWKTPLVYPFTAKKQETVDFESLKRLEDDEFLNDILIAFFQRVVEHKLLRTQPEQVKRVHLFNSYFFDSLTRNVKTKKDVNYQAVKKWTKNVNLFARDYVVVPVNLSYHWFLIIICNFKSLDPTKQEDDGADVDNDGTDHAEAEGPGPASDGAERDTRQSFEELSIQDTPRKWGKKASKKKRPPLQKYDPKAPVIISLDSLDQSRSVSCGYLKQYIVQAAAEKFPDHPIDEKDIKAMTAKNIPTQSNFSDCGLYLCLYLEHFLRDPDRFVRAILQREPFPWPEVIESEKLRGRYRDLLLQLHNHQESKTEETIPGLGSILAEPDTEQSRQRSETPSVQERQATPVDTRRTQDTDVARHADRERPVTPGDARRTRDKTGVRHADSPRGREGPATPEETRRSRDRSGARHVDHPRGKERSATPEETRRARENLEARVQQKKDTPLKATSDIPTATAAPDPESTRRRRLTPARSSRPETIVIDDDPESPSAHRKPDSVREKSPEPAQEDTQEDTPLELAGRLRQQRERTAPRESPGKSRSESVSTDFLHEGKMYKTDSRAEAAEAVEARTSKESVRAPVLDHIEHRIASQVSAEVPETPEDLEEVVVRSGSLPSWGPSDNESDEVQVLEDSLHDDGKAQENRAGTHEMIMK